MSDPHALTIHSGDLLIHAANAADKAAAQGVFVRYQAGLSSQTRRAQAVDLQRWANYLTDAGIEHTYRWSDDPAAWRDISWGLVEGFLRWQEQKGYSLASIARALGTVRTYCQHAARAGSLSTERLSLIQTVKAATPGSKAGRNQDAQRAQSRMGAKKACANEISLSQSRCLKQNHADTPQGRRDRLLMCLLLDHGLRISEVADLQVQDLDLEQGLLHFYRRKINRNQTHRLSKDTQQAAQQYVEAGDSQPCGQLLRRSKRQYSLQLDGAISTQGLRARVRILGSQVGINRLSPHDCRHFWATRAARAGTDPLALQEAGGWRSLAMPQRYVKAAEIANEGVRLDLGEER
ncbi:MAG: site-specific integrase [Oscillochloris sp.]|nr:site-specific integrase [Oscillochloris sp.]